MECKCQDSNYSVCGKPMTKQEHEQDGMCGVCADHVWAEMRAPIDEYVWTHLAAPECKH